MSDVFWKMSLQLILSLPPWGRLFILHDFAGFLLSMVESKTYQQYIVFILVYLSQKESVRREDIGYWRYGPAGL
jgi:hypothetical protein